MIFHIAKKLPVGFSVAVCVAVLVVDGISVVGASVSGRTVVTSGCVDGISVLVKVVVVVVGMVAFSSDTKTYVKHRIHMTF